MKWLLLAALIAAAPLGAETLEFKDVKYYQRKKPSDNPKKQDGVLFIDRGGNAIAFLKGDKVLCALSLQSVARMTYKTKGDKVLTVQFKAASGQGEFSEFELNTGKRDALMSTLEAVTGGKVERIQ
jgi:hypothetical protein